MLKKTEFLYGSLHTGCIYHDMKFPIHLLLFIPTFLFFCYSICSSILDMTFYVKLVVIRKMLPDEFVVFSSFLISKWTNHTLSADPIQVISWIPCLLPTEYPTFMVSYVNVVASCTRFSDEQSDS